MEARHRRERAIANRLGDSHWTGTRCGEHQGVSGGMNMYLTYRHQGEKATLNGKVILPEVRLEHIGKR